MSDVWTPGDAPPSSNQPAATPVQLVTPLIDDVKNHFVPYLLAGLGLLPVLAFAFAPPASSDRLPRSPSPREAQKQIRDALAALNVASLIKG